MELKIFDFYIYNNNDNNNNEVCRNSISLKYIDIHIFLF